MIYDKTTGSIAMSNHEPILLQLPGTLPFAEVKPHTATALQEMIERLSDQAAPPISKEDQSMDSSINNGLPKNDQQTTAPKIGKLRIHKSGKVVMRLQLAGQTSFVDLELNQGIKTNFYQELVAIDSKESAIHFLAQV